MINEPLFTIVTVVHNDAPNIEKTILNVLGQRNTTLEYIIIDGGSWDGTRQTIEKYKDRLAAYLSEPDHGIYHAMNKGVLLARGEWIIFMNSGDTFVTETILSEISKQLPTEPAVFYGDYIADYGEKGQRIIRAGIKRALYKMVLSHQSVVSHSSLVIDHPFDETLKISSDLDFYFKCENAGAPFVYFPKVISVRKAEGISDLNRMDSIKESYAVSKKHQPSIWVDVFFARIKATTLIKSFFKSMMPDYFQALFRNNI